MPSRLALVVLVVIAGALGGCGRRGGLEAPPGSAADPVPEVQSQAPAPGSGTGPGNGPTDAPPITESDAAPTPLPQSTVVGKPVGGQPAKPARPFLLDKVL